MIRNCDNPHCKSPFQDKEYGEKKRVMNPKTKDGGFRCTVCGREHLTPGSKK